MEKFNHIIGICAAAALSVAPSVNVCAQQLPNTVLERQIVESALHTIEEYEASVALGDDDSYYSFINLFVDDEVKIYNDMLGFSSSDYLPLKEYVHNQQDGLHNIIISIHDVYRDQIWFDEDNKWHIALNYSKNVNYSTKCGIYLSSMDYYQTPYRERMVMIFDEDQKLCKIEKIEGNIESSKKPLGKNYYVFQKNSSYDEKVVITGSKGENIPVKFNKHNQMLLPANINVAQAFRYPDTDVTTKINHDEQCHLVSLDYKARRYRIRPHASFALGDYYNVSMSDTMFSSKPSGFEFGIDFGYTFPSRTHIKTTLNFGLGYSSSKIDMAMQECDYSYQDWISDIDGDEYIRHYCGVKGTQSVKAQHLFIPIYLDFEWKFSQYLSAYFDIGAKAYLKIKEDNTDVDISVNEIYGVYPKYDNLILDNRWNFNGFSKEQQFTKAQDSQSSFKDFSMDIMGGIGLRIHPLSSQPLFLDLGLAYQFSIINPWYAGWTNVSVAPLNYEHAVLTHNGIREQVRGLSDAIESVRRQHLKFNIGIIYKF